MIYIVMFIFFVSYEIIWANLRVAFVVLMPGLRAQPAILYFPLSCTNNIQITVLANIISLTPGTLTLEISKDKKNLLLHTMFFTDKEKLVKSLRKKFEYPIRVIWP